MNPKTEEIIVGPIVPATLTRKELEAALKVSGRTICRLVARGSCRLPSRWGEPAAGKL